MSTPSPDGTGFGGTVLEGPGLEGTAFGGTGFGGTVRGRRAGVPAVITAGVVLAAAGGFAAHALWPSAGHPAAAAATAVATAIVIRTDLSSRQVVAGTLGYAGFFAVASVAPSGIITWLPSAGTIVARGQQLFQVSGQPATLLYGTVPAWRDYAPGMTPGPDIAELQRNLAALGFDPGPADGSFGWSTQAAVERWQFARGQVVTGTLPLGTVAFLPGPLRVTGAALSAGSPVSTGATVLSGTSVTPVVSVWLTVGGPVVKPGDPVLVTLPDGVTTVPGSVATVGQVAMTQGEGGGAGSGTGSAGSASSASAGGGSSGGSSGAGSSGAGSAAAFPVTITIAEPRVPDGLDQAPVQVAITQQRDRGVLAVPVTALLAQPGGGYAVAESGQAHQVIPVAVGLFDDATGLVEVSGRGLSAGLAVAVAQG
jgi:peptidoglycan hydrolase-like protein with peptidoglycan-binding domain